MNIYVYFEFREQLQNNANKGQYFLRVNMEDLISFDEPLADMVKSFPKEYMPHVIIHY